MQQASKPLSYTSGWVIVSWGVCSEFTNKIPSMNTKIGKTKKIRQKQNLFFFFFISLLQRGIVQVQKHYNCQEISHAIKTQCEWKVVANPNKLLDLE